MWQPSAQLLDSLNGQRLVTFARPAVWLPGQSRQLSLDSRGRFVYPPRIRALKDYLATTYGIRTFYARGRDAVLIPGQRRSPHQSALALDAMTSDPTVQHAIADDMLAHAGQWGIQEVITDHTIWLVREHPRPYTGSSPHTDHVHIEIGLDPIAPRNGVVPAVVRAANETDDPTPEQHTSWGPLIAATSAVAVVTGGVVYYRRRKA